eukprot:m.42630 g.42630  ORF g.42630 m.42630 type:complete len:134 (+) comp33373_c0_seq5:228-629(+)
MWENIRHDWNEKGIVGVLEFLEGEAQNLPAGTLRRWLCLLSLNFIQLTANWFSPQLMWPSEERLASFIQTSQWNDSQTRAMSWHPHLMKIAVAAKVFVGFLMMLRERERDFNLAIFRMTLYVCSVWAATTQTY